MSKEQKDLTRPPFQKKKRTNHKNKRACEGEACSPRSKLERWFDRHNHKMEFLRTFFGLLTLGLQAVILLKLFQFI
jgi:hypothetical protein